MVGTAGAIFRRRAAKVTHGEHERIVEAIAEAPRAAVKFDDLAGFTKAVHDHPAVPSCLVNRIYAFGTGRPATKDEAEWINYQVKQFIASGYKVPELMRRIASSKAFYRISTPGTEANNATLSMAGTGSQKEAAK